MNMNSDEIFKELKRDYQTILDVVNREIDKNKHKILKIYQQTKSPVPFKETKIINVSRNQYRAIIEAWPNKREFSKGITIYTIVNNGITGKKNAILFPSLDVNLRNIVIFEAHFMRRYRERYLKIDNIDFEKIVDIYLRSNSAMITTIIPEVQKEGEWNLEGKLNDGVALGIFQKDTKFFRFITYVSNEMLRENQIHLTDDSPTGQILQVYQKLKQEDRFACSNAVLSAGGFKEVNVNIFNRGD